MTIKPATRPGDEQTPDSVVVEIELSREMVVALDSMVGRIRNLRAETTIAAMTRDEVLTSLIRLGHGVLSLSNDGVVWIMTGKGRREKQEGYRFTV